MKQEKEKNEIDLKEVTIHVDVNNGAVERLGWFCQEKDVCGYDMHEPHANRRKASPNA